MNAGTGVADLRAGRGRQPVLPAGRAHRAAHGLRDRLVGLAVLVLAGSESLDRGIDDLGIDLVDRLPGEALPIERARREILDQDAALLDQLDEALFGLLELGVQRS